MKRPNVYCFFQTQPSIEINSLCKVVDFCTTLTRDNFEELNMKYWIYDIVLLGGSSHIPRIQQLLQDYCGGKYLNNFEEAVAYGATIQPAILCGDYSFQDFLLFDVTLLSLSIETTGGVMISIVKRNTTIPTKHALVECSQMNYIAPPSMSTKEYMNCMVNDNILLGKLELTDVLTSSESVPVI